MLPRRDLLRKLCDLDSWIPRHVSAIADALYGLDASIRDSWIQWYEYMQSTDMGDLPTFIHHGAMYMSTFEVPLMAQNGECAFLVIETSRQCLSGGLSHVDRGRTLRRFPNENDLFEIGKIQITTRRTPVGFDTPVVSELSSTAETSGPPTPFGSCVEE
jgi:hypothetical protein